MKADLIMPNRATKRAMKLERVTPLELTGKHPEARFYRKVLLLPDGTLLNGFLFGLMREMLGARIETDSPGRVCRALGVPPGELGITRRGDG